MIGINNKDLVLTGLYKYSHVNKMVLTSKAFDLFSRFSFFSKGKRRGSSFHLIETNLLIVGCAELRLKFRRLVI